MRSTTVAPVWITVVMLATVASGWEMRKTWKETSLVVLPPNPNPRARSFTNLNQTSTDEICKSPKGDLVSVCRQLEWYRTNAALKPGVTSTSVIAVLTGDRDSKSRELKLVEQKRENMADMVQLGIEGAGYAVQTLEKAAEYLEKMKTYTETAAKTANKAAKVLNAASKAFGALGTVASMCGPIGAGIGAVFSFIAIFVPQPDPNEKIMEQLKEGFDQMHDRFDRLDTKLEDIEFAVEKTAVYQMYKENQDRIHKLMFAHRQLFTNPSEEALRDFTDMCRGENPLYALEWIHRRTRESKSPLGLQLFGTIAKDTDFDRKRLAQFYEIITSDMMTAAYLREACLGALSPGNTRLVWRSRRVTSNLLSGISSAMKRLESQLANAFDQTKLKADLAKILDMQTEAGTKPQEIVTQVKEIFKSKYYWLNCHVFMVKGAVDILDGGGDHQYASIKGKKNPDLTMVVTWTESNPLGEKEVEYCRNTADKSFTENLYYLLIGFSTLQDAEYLKRLNVFLQSPAEFIKRGEELWKTTYIEATSFKTKGTDFRGNKVVTIFKSDNLLGSISDQPFCDLTIPMKGLRAFVTYYKSPTVHNTYGCTASGQQLAELKVLRTDVCPPRAMQDAVGSLIRQVVSASWATSTDAAGDVQDALLSSYSDLKWSVVVGKSSSQPFLGCNNQPATSRVHLSYQNCTFVNTSSHNILVSWSYGSDVLTRKQSVEAEKKIRFLQALVENKLIFEHVNSTQDLVQQVHDLITDPLSYFMNSGVSEEKIADRMAKSGVDFSGLLDGASLNPETVLDRLNFYENKVISVLPDGQTVVASNGGNADSTAVLQLKPPSEKKHLQTLSINIIYYKPYEMANTLHCSSSEEAYKATGLGDREALFGC